MYDQDQHSKQKMAYMSKEIQIEENAMEEDSEEAHHETAGLI